MEWRLARESGLLLRLALPLSLTTLAQLAITTTDLILLGALGAEDLAAAAMAVALYQVVAMFGLGVVTAAMPMLARLRGRQETSAAAFRDVVRQGLWSVALFCLPCWILLWHADAIFAALGQPPAIIHRSVEMMHALQWGIAPFLGYVVLRSFFAALERPEWTLLVAVVGVAFNAAAAAGLIFGLWGLPALGLVGAGVATSLTNLFMFAGLLAVAALHKRLRPFGLHTDLRFPGRPGMVAFWRLGLPMGITQVLDSSIFYAASNMMGWLGAEALAAHVINLQIMNMLTTISVGLSQAATVRVGQAFGAASRPAMLRASLAAYLVTVAMMAGAAVVLLVFPRTLLAIFIATGDPSNAHVVEVGLGLLAIGAVFVVADGLQFIGLGVLRGLHDTAIPMLIGLVGGWGIGLPLGAFLAFTLGMGAAGIWLGLSAGLGAVALLFAVRCANLATAR
ncbi:MAG: MATE family efflux transporter [Enhydrobacter sp.]|nr:MATE family efflux transporter [Enhydrobacter sp.]